MRHLTALQGNQPEIRRRLITVDQDSGEAVPGVVVIQRQRSPRYITEDYNIMFSTAIAAATEDKELGQQEWRVLMRLIAMLGVGDQNAWKSVNLSDLGKMLDMKRPNVSAAMKVLVEKGIVIKGVRIGRGHAYSLNPNFGWKGPAAQWPAASKAAPKMKLIKGGKLARNSDNCGAEPIKADRREAIPGDDTPKRRKTDATVEQILIDAEAPTLF